MFGNIKDNNFNNYECLRHIAQLKLLSCHLYVLPEPVEIAEFRLVCGWMERDLANFNQTLIRLIWVT